MNESYWSNFYSNEFHETKPSDFAIWARPRIKGRVVFDMGCGNGRDTEYLAQEHVTMGIDPCAPLSDTYARWTCEYFVRNTIPLPTDTLYARWFFHAVTEDVEDGLLDWIQGQLIMEARAVGDVMDVSHYRRPLEPSAFLTKLFDRGFTLNYFELSRDFSHWGEDSTPLLFRLEATK